MGVESIELDTVNLRMVARTLPGKQFEVGRRLRVLVVARAAPRRHRRRPTDSAPMVDAIPHPAADAGRRGTQKRRPRHGAASNDLGWPKATARRRIRTSTVGARSSRSSRCSGCSRHLPARRRHPRRRRPQVVPPGFVPDPNYTWVPRTNVQTARGVRRHDDHDAADDDHRRRRRRRRTPRPARRRPRRLRRRRRSLDPDGPGGPLPPETITQTPTPDDADDGPGPYRVRRPPSPAAPR